MSTSADETTKQAEKDDGFFESLRGAVLTSIPALSALVFVVVSVKVFRASMMETTTTVAIVSSADALTLLKGVILTLLPGFLAGLAALAIWWWAAVLPERLDEENVRNDAAEALGSAQAVFAWAMLVMAFFTIWWPVFLILVAPVLAITVVLATRWARGPRPRPVSKGVTAALFVVPPALLLVVLGTLAAAGVVGWAASVVLGVLLVVVAEAAAFGWCSSSVDLHLRGTMRVFGLLAAAVFVGILTLESSVWLPLRRITFVGDHGPVVKQTQLPKQVAGYVLSSDANGVSLLLDHPRAVVELPPSAVEGSMPLCVPPESRHRVLTVRASQVLGIDADPHSPYGECPGVKKKSL
jgi:hypothetical protein